MSWIASLLIVVQVIAALAVVVLVLLQHGKGADMGAAFGGGASGSLFGATGSANFLSRATGVAATVFFVATLGLAFTAGATRTSTSGPTGVMGTMPAGDPAKAVPAMPPPTGKAGEIPATANPAAPSSVPATTPPATKVPEGPAPTTGKAGESPVK